MKEVFEGKTYYDILEVSMDASPNEIIKAYEKIKEAYSPSSPALYTIFTAEEAQQLNSLIDSAFSVLSNPMRRDEYDQSIKKHFAKENLANNLSNELKSIPEDEDAKDMGKTSFGTYNLDPSFEEKICGLTEFDGDILQKIRHYKNINIEQLSEKSKISKSYILAIESHDFESLPAKVFVRGFIIQIAKLLDLKSELVSDSYMKIFNQKN